MDTPLLATKLYIPPVRPELVPRPRLIEQINAGLHHKLTLISAPAGFGKTTLITDWLRQLAEEPRNAGAGEKFITTSSSPHLPPPVTWLSLDDEDNDPVRFFTYLVTALEMVQPDAGEDARALLQSPKRPPLRSMLTVLINSLATLPDDRVLVMDDYHVIEEDSIHEGVAFLLEHMPPQMHLIIATRVDPPLPLARLRSRGQLVELREADLRFTRDEAMAFLNQAMGLGLPSEDVAALEAHTEGWIAGLQLAALSMRGHQDIPGFIAAFTGSQHYILDYLVEEVLQRQPESIQTFLLRTSILDRMTAPLCDAVVGEIGDWKSEVSSRIQSPASRLHSQAVLEYLQHANLFLIPLDDRGEWYRYHRLFADFLHARLSHQIGAQGLTSIHRQAGKWYAQHGLVAEAIEHALAAEDFEWAADLIEEVVEAIMMRSEIATFHSWLETLPYDIVRTRPRLCIYHAWALLLSGHPLETAEASLLDAEESDATGSVAGEIALFRALIATYQGKTQQSAELAQQALELLPEESLFLRSLVAGFLGINYLWSGDIATAKRTLQEAARISQKAGNLMNAVLAICHLAEVAMIEGQLNQAQTLYHQAFELALDERGRPRPIGGLARIGSGALLRERNELETAERHLVEGIELVKKWGEVGSLSGYGHLARLRQAKGDFDGARQAIQKAHQIARSFDAMEVDDRLVDVYHVQLWIAQGDLEATTRWAEERGPASNDGLEELRNPAGPVCIPIVRVFELIALAQVYNAQSRPSQTLKILEPLLAVSEAAGWTAFVMEILILQAIAFQAQGDTSQAMVSLERALALAEPGGFVRMFVDEGQPMAALLREAASRGIAPGYVGKLLSAFDAGEQSFPPAPRGAERDRDNLVAFSPPRVSPSTPPLVEPLSERELEVLSLIAAGLTNREIAEDLIIAVSTVKTHVNAIYRKLNVSKRTQAVARARELGLLY